MFYFHKYISALIVKATYPRRNVAVYTHVIWRTCVKHVKVSCEIVLLDPDPYHDVVVCNWLRKC